MTRFRGAIIQFSEDIKSASWDKSFRSDAEQVFYKNVGPATLDIEEAVKSNAELRVFLRTLVRDPAAFLSESAFAVVMTQLNTLPAELALSLGIGTSIAAAAVIVYRAYDEWAQTQQSIEQNQLYFYYQAGKRLEY